MFSLYTMKMMTSFNLLWYRLYARLNFEGLIVLFFNNMQKNVRVVTIDGYENVPVNDEKALKKAVAHQPVTVALEASGRPFQLYHSVGLSSHNNLLYVTGFLFVTDKSTLNRM